MLVSFARPINRQSYTACARDLIGQDLQAKPFGEVFRLKPWVVNEPRELFGGGFLIALRARQFSLIARLFVNDRKYELGDRLDLMAMRPRRHLFDKLFHACR